MVTGAVGFSVGACLPFTFLKVFTHLQFILMVPLSLEGKYKITNTYNEKNIEMKGDGQYHTTSCSNDSTITS